MKKICLRILAVLAVLIAVLLIASSFFIDEPLRRYAQQRMNDYLPGFSVHIRKLTTHPLSLSIQLDDVVILQADHPEPPVLAVRRLHGGLRWTALLTARLAADAGIERPRVYLDLERLRPVLERVKKAPAAKVPWRKKLEASPRPRSASSGSATAK